MDDNDRGHDDDGGGGSSGGVDDDGAFIKGISNIVCYFLCPMHVVCLML